MSIKKIEYDSDSDNEYIITHREKPDIAEISSNHPLSYFKKYEVSIMTLPKQKDVFNIELLKKLINPEDSIMVKTLNKK